MRDNLAIQDDTDDDLDDEIDHDSVIRPSKIEDLTPFPPSFKERRRVAKQWQICGSRVLELTYVRIDTENSHGNFPQR